MATSVKTAKSTGGVNFLNVTGGFKSWALTQDHKRIGLMYLFSVMLAFLVGGALALAVRLELIAPGETIMDSQTYNQVFTMHGVVMIFLFIIPSIPAALGNFFLPIMVGAKDVAFPKLNLASYYLWIFGAVFTVGTIIAGGIDTGWTFYTPQSLNQGDQVMLMGLGIFILGFSSIFTGINFLVTIHKLRAPGIGWFHMPLFLWSIYGTALIQVLATPVLAITLLLLLGEKLFQVGIFNPALGGDPVLFQHFFWFYSHPAVYIMILPGMGIISETITTFSRKHIFGYRFVAFSSIAIAVLGFLVWGHHMFVTAESEFSTMMFSFLTFFVAIPSAIKVFNWTATMYKGSIQLTTGMLYTQWFLFLFSIGGLTGVFLGALSTDIHLHDTYFVVAHFHYVMMGGTVMAFMAGLYYWWPKMTGRMYPERISQVASVLVFIGFNVTFLTQFVVGSKGMPRRYHDYLEQFQPLNQMSTFGSWILGFGILLAFAALLWSLRNGAKAPANPWGAAGIEWKTSSPPPLENFEEIPEITHGPYDYQVIYGGEKPSEYYRSGKSE